MIFIATGRRISSIWPIARPARALRAWRPGVKPAADKREGDLASPAGVWPIRRVLYRPDRGAAPATALPAAQIAPDDGWCDAPGDPDYNRPVYLPYPASAEHMWLESGVYDIVVILGHNDDPVVPGMGSAIFLHLRRRRRLCADGGLRGPGPAGPRGPAGRRHISATRWRSRRPKRLRIDRPARHARP